MNIQKHVLSSIPPDTEDVKPDQDKYIETILKCFNEDIEVIRKDTSFGEGSNDLLILSECLKDGYKNKSEIEKSFINNL